MMELFEDYDFWNDNTVYEVPVTDSLDPGSLPFLNYLYEEIASAEFQESAVLLDNLRSESGCEIEFYQSLMKMDVPKARKILGIGEVPAKRVNGLCEMIRRAVANPEAKKIFENRNEAEQIAPIVKDRISNSQNIRTCHAYQKLMDSCNGSVLNLYLRVIALPPDRVKLPELNARSSQELFNFLKDTISELYGFFSKRSANASNGTDDNNEPSESENIQSGSYYWTVLHNLGLSFEEIKHISSIKDRLGHFPMFTVFSCRFSKMKKLWKTISKRTLNIIYGNSIESLVDVALSLDISNERVRQIRNLSLQRLLGYPKEVYDAGLTEGFVYKLQSKYDFDLIRKEEGVDFSDEFITYCVSETNQDLSLVGDVYKILSRRCGKTDCLYLVPKGLHELFSFEEFISKVEEMIKEKRVYPYQDDLESFVARLVKKEIGNEDLFAIIKECRRIMVKSYPDNIINNQILFPENSRKNIPGLIEDLLREFNRPMTAAEIAEQLNNRYPDLETTPSKIGPNALRNKNIAAIGRSSTYTLAEWDHNDARGGTIRDIVVEYLNSQSPPIAPLADICDYISKFRKNVKESNVKANLLAEATNRFSLYYKDDVSYIGFSDYDFSDEYTQVAKHQGRRTFKDSIDLLEKFINENGRLPSSSGVSGEELRLYRFYRVAKSNWRKGLLFDEELAELERISEINNPLYMSIDRVSWDEMLEKITKYIIDNEKLPLFSSREYKWFEENLALYNAGELEPGHAQSFSFLLKVVNRMQESDSNLGTLDARNLQTP